MNRLRTVQLLGDHVEKAQEVRDKTAEALTGAGFTLTDRDPDLYVVIGGDGTYLHQMRELGFPDVPAVGVNAGSLGYFQEVEVDEIDHFVEDLKTGQWLVVDRNLLEVADENGPLGLGVNEVYVERAGARAMQAKLTIGQAEFARFVGDALIVATQQGSTAYAAAAGGPVLIEGTPVFEIVPSNSFDSTMYESIRAPLVIPDNSRVVIEGIDPEHRPLRAVADGAILKEGGLGYYEIYKAKQKLRVLRTERFDALERYAHKIVHRKQV